MKAFHYIVATTSPVNPDNCTEKDGVEFEHVYIPVDEADAFEESFFHQDPEALHYGYSSSFTRQEEIEFEDDLYTVYNGYVMDNDEAEMQRYIDTHMPY